MLKLLSKIFSEKPPALETAQDAALERMARMRRKTTEMTAMFQAVHGEDEQIESRKDILSKARDLEIGTSYKDYTTRAKDENARRNGSLIRDWHQRISHLPGFEVDPQF